MSRCLAAVAACCLMLPSPAAGQSKPNFTGRWTQQRDGRANQPPLTLTVFQDALTVTVDVSAGPADGGIHYVFNLDGTPSRNTITQGNPPRTIVQTSRATWAGDKLEIATIISSNSEGARTLTQSWSLAGGNLVLTASEVSHRTGAVVRETRTIYVK